MGKIRAERIEAETQLPVLSLLRFHGKTGINRHCSCSIRFQLQDDMELNDIWMQQESKIVLYERNDDGDVPKKTIFSGIIDDIRIDMVGNSIYAEVEGIAHSILLDREKKRRSFQNVNMTYYEIAKEVVRDYPDVVIQWNLDNDRKIEKPLIQYEETDWEFLIRLSSHFHSVIWTEESRPYPVICMGMGKSKDMERMDDTVYEYGISSLYYEHVKWMDSINKDNYIYYTLRKKNNCLIGDLVQIEDKRYAITDKEFIFEKGELTFFYKAGTRAFFKNDIIFRQVFSGLQLDGEIEDVEEDAVYIRLGIDGDESQILYPFPWEPKSSNIFYCMPEVGTQACLRINGIDEREAAVIDVLRTNGNICSHYEMPQNKIFETINKKTLKLFPEELSIEGNKTGTLPELSIKDGVGIEVTSQQKISMEAKGNISLEADKLICSAPVGIVQCAAESSLEIHQDFNLYSPQEVSNLHVDSKDKEEQESKKKKTFHNVPCCEGAYTAMGAVASFGSDIGEMSALGMACIAGMPSIGGGKATDAMCDAVNGIAVDNIKYAGALQTIKINTLNGGYPLPKKIKKD